MNFWNFASEHPLVVFFGFWIGVYHLFLGFNRILRCINIGNRGYPPPHCDADGDFKPEKDEEEE